MIILVFIFMKGLNSNSARLLEWGSLEGTYIKEREWQCPNCRTILDRALNTPTNILNY